MGENALVVDKNTEIFFGVGLQKSRALGPGFLYGWWVY
jgi:hypothetical protein